MICFLFDFFLSSQVVYRSFKVVVVFLKKKV